jgi:Na+-driven multidrug efflux pump
LLFYIPALLLLPRTLGLRGVFFAAPTGDILAAILSVLFMAFELKRLTKLKHSN